MLKKILVPVDGSPTALNALNLAMAIGAKFDSEIIALHINIPYDYTKLPPRKPKTEAEAEEMARKPKDPTPLDAAQKVAAEAGYGKIVFRQMVDTNPADKIVEAVEQSDVDMVVMGNRGMGVWSGLLMGSVSAKVSQTVECPVIIVK